MAILLLKTLFVRVFCIKQLLKNPFFPKVMKKQSVILLTCVPVAISIISVVAIMVSVAHVTLFTTKQPPT